MWDKGNTSYQISCQLVKYQRRKLWTNKKHTVSLLQPILCTEGWWITIKFYRSLKCSSLLHVTAHMPQNFQALKGKRIQWSVDLTEELNCWNMQWKWWKGSSNIEISCRLIQMICSLDLWKIKEPVMPFFVKQMQEKFRAKGKKLYCSGRRASRTDKPVLEID